MTSRPSWDEYGLALAKTVSLRADCTRRPVGAVILDTDNRIIGAGYNGTRPGDLGCLAGGCPRGRHYEISQCPGTPHPADCKCRIFTGHCACGNRWPCDQAVDPGSSYDTGPGACTSTHAELNARMDVDDRSRLTDARLYCTDKPCDGCIKIFYNATKVATMRWPDGVINLRERATRKETI